MQHHGFGVLALDGHRSVSFCDGLQVVVSVGLL